MVQGDGGGGGPDAHDADFLSDAEIILLCRAVAIAEATDNAVGLRSIVDDGTMA